MLFKLKENKVMLYHMITKSMQHKIVEVVERTLKNVGASFKTSGKDAIEFGRQYFKLSTDQIELSSDTYFDEEEIILAVSEEVQSLFGLFWSDTDGNKAIFEF